MFASMKYLLYLCIVFFIVLDLRFNKGWTTAVVLFLCLYVYKQCRPS